MELQPNQRDGSYAAPSIIVLNSAYSVYGLPELLEQILSFLCMRDLLRAGQTNKYFRILIRSSKALKQNLWLDPMLPAKEDSAGQNHAVMPLRCPGLSVTYCQPPEASSTQPTPETLSEVGTLTVNVTPCELSAFLSNRSDLSQMLITQPPITSMVRKAEVLLYGTTINFGSVENAEGLRICDLLQRAIELCKRGSHKSWEGLGLNCLKTRFEAKIRVLEGWGDGTRHCWKEGRKGDVLKGQHSQHESLQCGRVQ